MISKISRLLTTALLLAVSFNNSYATNNMNLNDNNNIVQNENNTNNTDSVITRNNVPIINMQKVVQMDRQKASDIICPIIPQIQTVLNAADYKIVKLDTVRNIRIYTSISFSLNDKDFAALLMQEAKDTAGRRNRRTSKLNKKNQRIDFRNLLSPIINQMQTALHADESNLLVRINSELLYHSHKMLVDIYFNFNTQIIADHIHQILNNININNNVNENIKYFFNTYIGNKYNGIFGLFHIKNIQLFDDIKAILDNNIVKEYLAIGAIQSILDIDLDKRRFFKGGVDDQGVDNKPANYNQFKDYYLKYVKNFIDNKYKHNINNIRNYINNTIKDYTSNPCFTIENISRKNMIKDQLNTCINDREQYLNQKLQEITDNIGNIYQEYLDSYKDGNNKGNKILFRVYKAK